MATLILSAVGAQIGASAGGAVLGISSAVIGRAVGATVGRVIDQRLLGGGSRSVETGRVERFRLSSAGEGDPVEQVHARMRVPGQVIWATNFRETVSTTTTGGGGKGGARQPATTTTEYRYSVSLALALCEGVAARVDRVWANGQEIAPDSLSMRFHTGAPDQAPDPKIEAVEGTGNAPAYRGVAYVVIEDMDLAPFGNRVPQFAFEVLRPAQPKGVAAHPRELVQGVALIPGTGEYSLATTPVHYAQGPGRNVSANVHSAKGVADLEVALDALEEELPQCGSVALVVSWFGDNLKCGDCTVEPRVEQTAFDSPAMPWSVSGTGRGAARAVSVVDGRPVYGGTPADAAVIEAIQSLNARGKAVCFYPFILMDIQAGNGLGDPWTGAADQPVMPWRGRIRAAAAAGTAADAEVAAFFGTAKAADFAVSGGSVTYSGPAEWSFSRFILHYAALCAAAGGVESFLIGSEMRGLTQARGANGFPAVDALVALAAEVRAILGAGVKIGYAADWSEYFGYRPDDGSGDVYFHLDPLWADANIDFIGIDNYMPLSDWRDGTAHADADWGSIYNPAYLDANIEGGEGFDWYYASDEARAKQIRTPIADSAHGEDWVFRYKDLRSWWRLEHHERIGGVRQATPTAWVPESKPIRFTELGCAAIDKGTNQPNVFLDAKSSESEVPYFSTGARDDLIQFQYLSAMYGHWSDAANNPVSTQYAGPMIDLVHSNVWAWDARPFPVFPNDTGLWSDGPNYPRGHWISGRMGTETLARAVAEITERCGVNDYDVSGLHGVLRGYHSDRVQTGRAALQPLMLAYGFDALDREGRIVFRPRAGGAAVEIDDAILAEGERGAPPVSSTRAGADGRSGRVRVQYIEADGAYAPKVAEAASAGGDGDDVQGTALPLVLTPGEAQATADRWMGEAAVARDRIRFTLPPSQRGLGVGDVVARTDAGVRSLYRIERAETRADRTFEAVRIEAGIYAPQAPEISLAPVTPFIAPVPVAADFLELPLLTGAEDPVAPHLAVLADPWPGSVAVYAAASGNGYALNSLVAASAVVGVTETALAAAVPGRWDRSDGVIATFVGGVPSSASEEDVLNGANVAAIGNGDPGGWEVFQFRDATLLSEGRYRLSGLLRGQAGSDAEMAASWAPGAKIVLLTGAVKQIALAASARGLSRTYRIGDARVGYDHSSYIEQAWAFEGRGLRPLSPVHLRAVRDGAGDITLSWIRRTRIDGDGWEAPDVPLGEASEVYDVRILASGAVVRTATVFASTFTYTAADRAADGVTGPFEVEVAQVSDRYGAGPYERITVDG